MIFHKKEGVANVATAVERTARYTVVLQSNDRRPKPIMGHLIDELAPLPAQARRSLTFNCGLEFVSWRELETGLGVRAWGRRPSRGLQGGLARRLPQGGAAPRGRLREMTEPRQARICSAVLLKTLCPSRPERPPQ